MGDGGRKEGRKEGRDRACLWNEGDAILSFSFSLFLRQRGGCGMYGGCFVYLFLAFALCWERKVYWWVRVGRTGYCGELFSFCMGAEKRGARETEREKRKEQLGLSPQLR